LDDGLLRMELEREHGALPLFEQIRLFVSNAVANGTLPPGVRLPPERLLAAAIGVSRATVMRAYQELAADGLVRAAPSRGTIIAPARSGEDEFVHDAASWALGLLPLARIGAEPALLQDIMSASQSDHVISLASAAPPDDLVPTTEIMQALARALDQRGARLLGYGPVDGLADLRELLADRMDSMGALKPSDRVIILSGATQGLSLAARVLVGPGDEVAIEAPTYVGTVRTFEAAGARLIGVPVDGGGVRPDSLEQVLSRRRVRLIVLQPNFQNPTGAVLSGQRREQILWLAQKHGVPILEDDAYGSLYRKSPGPAPLKQLDRTGIVVYMSSFSKTLAAGLRVAWMCGPGPVISRIALAKQYSDLNTNSLGQAVVGEFLRSGSYDRHLEQLRGVIGERMWKMHEDLSSLRPALQVDSLPSGGLHFWCRVRGGDSTSAVRAAAAAGVAIVSGHAFFPSGAQTVAGAEHVRLSLPPGGPAAATEGLRRLAVALSSMTTSAEPSTQPLSVVV